MVVSTRLHLQISVFQLAADEWQRGEFQIKKAYNEFVRKAEAQTAPIIRFIM